ncbi:MAG: glycosyltransferase family 4 protein [Planctomycetota bacterium]
MTARRVDLLITELNVGGAERCLTQLALHRVAEGDQMRVATLGPLPQPPHDQFVIQLKDANIPVASMGATRLWNTPVAYQRLKCWLENADSDSGIRGTADVLQSFLHHANVLGMWAASSLKIPRRFTGVRVSQNRFFRSMIERSAARRSTGLVCVSNSVAKFAEDHLATTGTPIHVIPNGVDVQHIQNAGTIDWSSISDQIEPEAIKVLWVGRFDPQKGTERLIEIAKYFDKIQRSESKATNPRESARRVQIIVIGDGPQRSMLSSVAGQLSGNAMVVLPWQSDIATCYAAADALLLTSHYEGMPNVVMEAMAAGLPIVATNADGVVQLLGEDEEGRRQWFDQSGDCLRESTLRIERLAQSSELRQNLGQRNQAIMQSDFSYEAMSNAYADLWFG